MLPVGFALLVTAVFWFRTLPVLPLPLLLSPPRCSYCRYGPTDLGASGICPECGSEFDFRDWLFVRPVRLSRRAQLGLELAPLVFAFAAGIAGYVTNPYALDPYLALLALASGLIAVFPAITITLASRGRIVGPVAWTLCVLASAPGAVAVAVLVGNLNTPVNVLTVDTWNSAIEGVAVSMTVGGTTAFCIASQAVRRHRATQSGSRNKDRD